MQAKPGRSVPATRLPVTGREFSELLRNQTSKSIRPFANRSVKSIGNTQMDLRPGGSGDPEGQRRFANSQLEHPVSTLQHSCYNPCDSPHTQFQSIAGEYPNGFEAWA